MNIAVVGMGWVGKKIISELMHRGHEVYAYNHLLWKQCQEYISSLPKLDYVVNCAGYTGYPNVDACELDKPKVYYANASMPIEMYNFCKYNDIRFAHFSSGCIYQGEIENRYAEPNFFGSTYSISKGISDDYLKYKSLVFRIRMPFTAIDEPKNLISKILYYAKHGKLYNGGQNSLTNLDEAIIIACDLIESGSAGPYNLVNKGSLDMKKIAEIMNLGDIKWFNEEEFNSTVKCVRSNCVIPSHSQMSNVEESLTNCIKKILGE